MTEKNLGLGAFCKKKNFLQVWRPERRRVRGSGSRKRQNGRHAIERDAVSKPKAQGHVELGERHGNRLVNDDTHH